jgi:hypothetical protein
LWVFLVEPIRDVAFGSAGVSRDVAFGDRFSESISLEVSCPTIMAMELGRGR